MNFYYWRGGHEVAPMIMTKRFNLPPVCLSRSRACRPSRESCAGGGGGPLFSLRGQPGLVPRAQQLKALSICLSMPHENPYQVISNREKLGLLMWKSRQGIQDAHDRQGILVSPSWKALELVIVCGGGGGPGVTESCPLDGG